MVATLDVIVQFSAGPIRVASIDDMIEMKIRAGRSQDSADLEALEALRK